MKTIKQWIMTGSMAALSLSLLTGVQAQNAEGRARVGGAEGKASVNVQDRDHDRDLNANVESHKSVTKFNRASSLIGMNVKNQQGEGLGEIKDLVLDLQSGKISYAVLSVGGFLGIRDKLIAIPPSVFTMDTTDNKLVLNADKAKLQQAPGFARNNWPDVENPAWGAYWGVSNDSGSIRGNAEFGTEKSDKFQNKSDKYQKHDRDLKDHQYDRDRK